MATHSFSLNNHTIAFDEFDKLVVTPTSGGTPYERELKHPTTINVSNGNFIVIEGPHPGSTPKEYNINIIGSTCQGYVFEKHVNALIGVEDLRFITSDPKKSFETHSIDLSKTQVEIKTVISSTEARSYYKTSKEKEVDFNFHQTCPK